MSSCLLIALFAALPATDPPKTDADKIQGTWDVFRIERNGKAQPKDALFRIKVTFDGDKLFTKVGKRPPEPQGTFKLDPSQTPKAYDLTTAEGSTVHGIYELEGDTLKVCLSAPGDQRPTAMKTTPDDDRTLIIYQREKVPEGR
ncbi:MAG TPA: TIGR03067 domain-containing protein [Isosphaeraceae bacterium]|jgi:uncharacterized protein (TIGR03067 family)|nr:TIGR03067 domain-containing protein [Isosphaeraceae bacterium]